MVVVVDVDVLTIVDTVDVFTNLVIISTFLYLGLLSPKTSQDTKPAIIITERIIIITTNKNMIEFLEILFDSFEINELDFDALSAFPGTILSEFCL